jgi:catechol 2,3-dioxygenase-like lactoylglutathione lyase family enzyme
MAQAPRLFRLILQVSDIEQASDFYAALLGVPARPVSIERHYFDCGPVILAIVNSGPSAQPMPDHIYLAVADIEDIHARAQRLGCLSLDEVHGAAAGEIVTRPWGERSFYVRDPFGNGLCFVDEQAIFTGR